MRYFAEFLRKIGIITVVAEDVTAVNVISISGNKLVISFVSPDTVEEQTKELLLPCECNPIPTAQLPNFKENPKNVLTLRLRVKQSGLTSVSTDPLLRWEDEGRWRKKDLERLTKFSLRCKRCKTQVLSSEEMPIKLKSLPSENWYELMDYWHCHKPATPSDGVNYQISRNSLNPSKGEVLIGGSYFLISKDTANGDLLENSNDENAVFCKSCATTRLGTVNSDGTLKIFKWSLQLVSEHKTEQFDPADDILITLLDIAKNRSERYLILKHGNSESTLVMLFATGNPVTLTDGTLLPNAIKLLYSNDKQLITSTKENRNFEEITPLDEPYEDFIGKLAKVNKLLPSVVAHFGSWNVSYLQLS